jgi:flagellar hook-associated protein 2
MADAIGSVSGLSSGVQWRDMIDQIMAIESQRRLDPIKSRASDEQKRTDAWGTYQGLVAKFRDAAKTLRDGSAFGAFKVNVGNSATSGRALLAASASVDAAPGTYQAEVLDLARANKLSGDVVASTSTALGLTGEFAINGRVVSIVASDTLSRIRDKINAVNAGTGASGVTATVLSSGAGQNRLVLTSDSTGADGIELVDGTTGPLAQLGVVDSTTTLNLGADGGTQSYHVSAATAAIATMMGVSMPPPSTITINGRTISVDLTVDSLASIAAKIAAAGGTADVVSEKTADGRTTYQLVTDGTATAATADGQRTLAILGLVRNTRSSIAQVVQSQNQFTDAADAVATAGTLLTDLKVSGSALGIGVGDTFSISGVRGDGSAVTVSLTVGASDTLQTVLDQLNDATSGFGAGARTATATLSGGRIVLTDNKGGDSQLALAMSVSTAGGSTIGLGRTDVSTVGRLREVVAGSDARVRVDGVVLARPSNTITDAIGGLTLDLQQAEAGTTVGITVTRDKDSITRSVQDVATAYNDLVKFVSAQAASGSPLANSATLRAAMSSMTSVLLSDVSGAPTGLARAGSAGLALAKDGTLTVDTTALTAALTTRYADLVSMFSMTGTPSSADVVYVAAGDKTKAGTYDVSITAAATTATSVGTGFSGTYADDGTSDTMAVTESLSGLTASIQLANGDTTDTIADKLNAAFAAQKIQLTATNDGGQLRITHLAYGLAATYTVAYTGGGTDGSAQLGFAAGTYAGTDVAGTIGGLAATGAGQSLTGAAGGDTEGLIIRYTGATTGAMGTVKFVVGAAGALYRAADLVARSGDGTVATQQDLLQRSIQSLNTRADTVQQALDRRRAALVAQFTAMEAAIARIQTQATSLTSFMQSLRQQQQS